MIIRVVFTGGGTGGHLFPIIAVARELKKIIPVAFGEEPEMLFIGPSTIGDEALAKEGIAKKTIMSGKVRRYISGHNFLDIFRLIGGFFQALFLLFSFMPNVVFAKGGYGSVPVVLVAWLFGIPVLIHESDSVPGLANRFLSRFAKRVAVSFSAAAASFPAKKTALLGNPVRAQILGGSKDQAVKLFGLNGQKPILLFLGGSQGAQAINDILFLALPLLLEKCEVVHQCGTDNFDQIKKFYGETLPPNYHLFPFLDEEQMKHILAAADLIISRAGAGSIFEIAAAGKPSILIPLPNSAGDHQNLNAIEYSKAGAAIVIEQSNLTPNLLKDRIFNLLNDKELLAKMSQAALAFARPKADEIIAQEILNIIKT